MNVHIQISLGDSALNSFEYILRRLLGHMVLLFLIFWGTVTLFSMAAVPIIKGYKFSTSLPRLILVFINGHPNGCEVICGLKLHFS